MAVLLTGAFGFMGLNIAEALLRGARDAVLVDVNAPRPVMLDLLGRHPGRFVACRADVRDGAAMQRILDDHDITEIIHAAAITADADREKVAAATIFETNLLASISLVEAAHRRGIRRFLYLSSGSVYGASAFQESALDEAGTAPRPTDLYPVSKYATELTVLRLAALLGLNAAAVRLTEVFGRWEFETGSTDTLSPVLQLTRHAAAGNEAVLPRAAWKDRGYSVDVAEAIVAVLEAPAGASLLFNIGPGARWPLTQWCECLAARYPLFRWQIAAAGEPANVDCFGDHDRAPLAVERLRHEIGVQARFDAHSAYVDFMGWLDSDPRLSALLLPGGRIA